MPELIAIKQVGRHAPGKQFRESKYMAKALVALGRAQYLTRDMEEQPVIKTVAPAPPLPVPAPEPEPVVEVVAPEPTPVVDAPVVVEDVTIDAPKAPPLPSKPRKTTKKDAE